MNEYMPEFHSSLLDFILIFPQTFDLLTCHGLDLSFSMLGPSSLFFSHTDWAAQQPGLLINCGVTRKKTRIRQVKLTGNIRREQFNVTP